MTATEMIAASMRYSLGDNGGTLFARTRLLTGFFACAVRLIDGVGISALVDFTKSAGAPTSVGNKLLVKVQCTATPVHRTAKD